MENYVKILFVARHGCGDNQDEEAIAHALRQLGHEVFCVHEMRRHRNGASLLVDADFCLCLKWPTVSELAEVAKRMPCAYWHFDMIRSQVDDPTLRARSESRIRWCRDVNPHVVLGFHTDGDFVAEDETGKLRWLMQGADERTLGYGAEVPEWPKDVDIIFTGMKHHGRDRANHIDHLQQRWGDRFAVVGDGGPKRRLHGRELADLFASVKIVVAPDGPNTDRYWSNRAYLTLGLGGFLLHPHCEWLRLHYVHSELHCYHDRDQLDNLIENYLDNPDEREALRRRGHEATKRKNLYRHRCAQLVKMMEDSM